MRSLLQQSLEREIRHDKLVAELSKYTGNDVTTSKNIAQLATSLEPFLKSMFQGLETATKFSKDPQYGRAAAFATGQILQYCFDEEDLFPEREYGILGLLDDAYLVHRFTGMLHQMYPHIDTSGVNYGFADEWTLKLVRALLPAGVCDALDRTSYNLIHVANALFTAGTRENIDPKATLSTLRINEAISILTRKETK
jgi:hypothetical protein